MNQPEWKCHNCLKPDNKPYHQWCDYCQIPRPETEDSPITYKGKGKFKSKDYTKGKGKPYQSHQRSDSQNSWKGQMPYFPDPDHKNKGKSKGIQKGLPTWLTNKISQTGISQSEYEEIPMEESSDPHSPEQIAKIQEALETIKAMPNMEETIQKLEITLAQHAPKKSAGQISSQIRSYEDQITDRTQKLKEAIEVEGELTKTIQKIKQVKEEITTELASLKTKLQTAQTEFASTTAGAQMELIEDPAAPTKALAETKPTPMEVTTNPAASAASNKAESTPATKIQRTT